MKPHTYVSASVNNPYQIRAGLDSSTVVEPIVQLQLIYLAATDSISTIRV